jgi:integrase
MSKTKTRRSTGSGSILTRTAKSGQVTYYGKWYVDGRQVKRKLGPARSSHNADGLTKVQAEARLRELMADAEVTAPADTRLTIAGVCELYLEGMKKRGKKPSSIRTSRAVLRRWIVATMGDKKMDAITPEMIEDLMAMMEDADLAPKTIRNYVLMIGAVYRFAMAPITVRRHGTLATRNPVEAVEVPSTPRYEEIRWIPADQVLRLADCAVPGEYQALDRALYLTAAMTGLRHGELMALRWRDVDLTAGKVRVRESWDRHAQKFGSTKGARERHVPLGNVLAGELERYAKGRLGEDFDPDRHAGELVFGDPATGDPMAAHQVYRRYREAKAAAEVREDLRFHDLRHTFGTMMATQGVPMTAIQSWMGHADLETTQRYAKYAPTPEHDRHAVDEAFQVTDELAVSTPASTPSTRIAVTAGR